MRRFIITLVLLMLVGCAPDAPHINPHDPLNPDAKGAMKGKCISIYGYEPIPGAIITVFPGTGVDTTDAHGDFAFSGLKPDTYLISAYHTAYIRQYDTVSLEGGEEKDIDFVLNGKPIIIDHAIYSIHAYSTYSRYIAHFRLCFSDIDANIADSVIAESEYEKVRLEPSSVESLGIYEKEVAHVNIAALDTLVGIPFDFWIKDLIGAYSDTVSASLVRVLHECPEIIFPDSLDTLHAGDTLRWIPPSLGNFSTTALIKFWEFGGSIDVPDWISDTLNGLDSSFLLSDSLKPGEYDYAIEIIDEFGNTARTIQERILVE